MTTFRRWLNKYSERHWNPVDKSLHWLYVPQLVFSVWIAAAIFEGMRPSFFKNLPLLLTRQLWLFADVQRRMVIPVKTCAVARVWSATVVLGEGA